MLRLSKSFIYSTSNINSSNINCSNINSSNINFSTTISTNIGTNVIDRNGFDHSSAVLTITNQTPTTSGLLNDSLPVLNLCRMNTAGVSIGARATFCLSRYENNGVNSRTLLDLKLLNDASMTTSIKFYSNGEVFINGTLSTDTILLNNESIITSDNAANLIQITQTNQKILLKTGSANIIYLNIGTSKTNMVNISSTNFNINGKLIVRNSATINSSLDIPNNFINSTGRWFKTASTFSLIGTNQYRAGFDFSFLPDLIKNKTYICDCCITIGGTKTSASYGFTQIVKNRGDIGTQNAGYYKYLYFHNIAAIDWFGSWNNALNIYVNTSELLYLRGALCIIRLICLE